VEAPKRLVVAAFVLLGAPKGDDQQLILLYIAFANGRGDKLAVTECLGAEIKPRRGARTKEEPIPRVSSCKVDSNQPNQPSTEFTTLPLVVCHHRR